MHLFVPCKHSGCIVSSIYRKSSFYPPPPRGGYLFQTRLRGSLKEPGAYLGGWGLFDLAKMVLSVLHKKTRMRSGLAQVQEIGGHLSRGLKMNPNFQHVNKSFRINPNEVFKSRISFIGKKYNGGGERRLERDGGAF